LLLLLLLLGIV